MSCTAFPGYTPSFQRRHRGGKFRSAICHGVHVALPSPYQGLSGQLGNPMHTPSVRALLHHVP
eukprot:12887340-Prorocentrum_lima.AAC.1